MKNKPAKDPGSGSTLVPNSVVFIVKAEESENINTTIAINGKNRSMLNNFDFTIFFPDNFSKNRTKKGDPEKEIIEPVENQK